MCIDHNVYCALQGDILAIVKGAVLLALMVPVWVVVIKPTLDDVRDIWQSFRD